MVEDKVEREPSIRRSSGTVPLRIAAFNVRPPRNRWHELRISDWVDLRLVYCGTAVGEVSDPLGR